MNKRTTTGGVTWGVVASIVATVTPIIAAVWVFNAKIDNLDEDLNENHLEVVQRLSVVETDVKNIKNQVDKLKD
jgi:TM2 domain-containing membrane protein YozV